MEKTIQENKKMKKEEERLAKEKAKQEERERKKTLHLEKLQAKQREKLVKKLGVQKPGKYVIAVESQDVELIDRFKKRLGNIPDFQIDAIAGSREGCFYGIHFEESVPVLLRITDLPEVSQVKLDHKKIKVSVARN
jgi:hypothetical protein